MNLIVVTPILSTTRCSRNDHRAETTAANTSGANIRATRQVKHLHFLRTLDNGCARCVCVCVCVCLWNDQGGGQGGWVSVSRGTQRSIFEPRSIIKKIQNNQRTSTRGRTTVSSPGPTFEAAVFHHRASKREVGQVAAKGAHRPHTRVAILCRILRTQIAWIGKKGGEGHAVIRVCSLQTISPLFVGS